MAHCITYCKLDFCTINICLHILIYLQTHTQTYRYRFGPQPYEFSGQRSLDFVLDNPTLYDLNRTLLMDIKLLKVRKAR